MRKVMVAFAVFITYIALAVGISTLYPSKALSQGPETGLKVQVVNTPLPVSGSVTGTVTGSVSITNTPNVNIANASIPVTGGVGLVAGTTVGIDPTANTVQVSNLPASPAAKSPTTITLADFTTPRMSYTVPSDKWLVIQDASFHGTTGGTNMSIYLVAGGTSAYYVPIRLCQEMPTYNEFVGGRTVCWYFSPGTVIEVWSLATDWSGGSAVLVGYLTTTVE